MIILGSLDGFLSRIIAIIACLLIPDRVMESSDVKVYVSMPQSVDMGIFVPLYRQYVQIKAPGTSNDVLKACEGDSVRPNCLKTGLINRLTLPTHLNIVLSSLINTSSLFFKPILQSFSFKCVLETTSIVHTAMSTSRAYSSLESTNDENEFM